MPLTTTPSAIDIFPLTGPNRKQIGSISDGVDDPWGLSIDSNNSLYVANACIRQRQRHRLPVWLHNPVDDVLANVQSVIRISRFDGARLRIG